VCSILCRAVRPDSRTHQNVLDAHALNVLGVVGNLLDATPLFILMPVCINTDACMLMCPLGPHLLRLLDVVLEGAWKSQAERRGLMKTESEKAQPALLHLATRDSASWEFGLHPTQGKHERRHHHAGVLIPSPTTMHHTGHFSCTCIQTNTNSATNTWAQA
jgi:hypothetical protein